MLRRCDAIALNERYLDSAGSVGEEEIAIELKLKRFYFPDDLQSLKDWITSDDG